MNSDLRLPSSTISESRSTTIVCGVIAIRNGKAVIDYDFCKGCGICAKICRLGAIRTEAEHK